MKSPPKLQVAGQVSTRDAERAEALEWLKSRLRFERVLHQARGEEPDGSGSSERERKAG